MLRVAVRAAMRAATRVKSSNSLNYHDHGKALCLVGGFGVLASSALVCVEPLQLLKHANPYVLYVALAALSWPSNLLLAARVGPYESKLRKIKNILDRDLEASSNSTSRHVGGEPFGTELAGAEVLKELHQLQANYFFCTSSYFDKAIKTTLSGLPGLSGLSGLSGCSKDPDPPGYFGRLLVRITNVKKAKNSQDAQGAQGAQGAQDAQDAQDVKHVEHKYINYLQSSVRWELIRVQPVRYMWTEHKTVSLYALIVSATTAAILGVAHGTHITAVRTIQTMRTCVPLFVLVNAVNLVAKNSMYKRVPETNHPLSATTLTTVKPHVPHLNA